MVNGGHHERVVVVIILEQHPHTLIIPFIIICKVRMVPLEIEAECCLILLLWDAQLPNVLQFVDFDWGDLRFIEAPEWQVNTLKGHIVNVLAEVENVKA